MVGMMMLAPGVILRATVSDGVALIDGTCQGCFVKVTAQESQLLSQEDELVRCRSCARILVLPV